MISFFTSAYSLLRLAALRLAVSCGLISAANAVVVGPLLASQRTRGESVSREEKVAVVEAYLRGLAGKDISKIPFAANITFEGPRADRAERCGRILDKYFASRQKRPDQAAYCRGRFCRN